MNIFQDLKPLTKVYETESSINGKIRIIDVGRTRKLIVGGILQSVNADSPLCPRLYWGKVIEILQENFPELKSLLLLGLGGGTLVPLLTRNFPELAIVSVELDPEMVEIANKYFDIDKVANHRVIVSDAMKVVAEPEEFGLSAGLFDVAMVDIYVGDTYPELGKSGTFVAALKSLVRPGGLVIFNRIYLEHHQDDVNNFINYISEFLVDVKCLVVAGYTNSDNVLIYGRTG